mgnify:CR=1 FL=1
MITNYVQVLEFFLEYLLQKNFGKEGGVWPHHGVHHQERGARVWILGSYTECVFLPVCISEERVNRCFHVSMFPCFHFAAHRFRLSVIIIKYV